MQIFKVVLITIQEWEKKLKEEGTLKKKPVIRSFRKVDPEKVKLYFAEHPDAYLREEVSILQKKLSLMNGKN